MRPPTVRPSLSVRQVSLAIEPPPNFGTSVRRDFIRAMGKRGDRFVIILEPDRAFDVDEMANLCEASQEALAA